MIQSASYLVCFGKREKKRQTKKEKKKQKAEKKREKEKEKRRRKERRKKQISDLSRLNLVADFGLESVLRTVQ